MTLYINTKDSKTVTVELSDKQRIVDSLSENNQFGSQALLPLIQKILNKNKVSFNQIDEIEVEEGPGSFTGLRVGAAVAQAMGFALNKPVNRALNKPVDLRYQ